MFLVFGNRVRASPTGSPAEFQMVMNHMAIVDDMEFCLAGNFPCFIENGTMKGNVISLPLSRTPTGIDQRLGPAIKSTALPIRIGIIFVGIQNLNLVLTHKKDTTVPTTLPTPLCFSGGGEFNVLFTGSNLFLALQVTASPDRFQSSVH